MLTNDHLSDTHIMLEALRLASLRRGFCAPNPSVGAVLVKAGEIIARGLHWASGCAHAEIDALNKVELEAARGATLYVTLEPCCHFGKTPPCTQRIIASGVARVVYGLRDPNPLVTGKGAQALLDAGIVCHHFELSEVTKYYRSYCYWQQTQQPWVTAKLALSLDGKIAGKGGQQVAITGSELAEYTHQCRKRTDAILTTAKTIVHDDPRLNVRLGQEEWKKPVYILDRLLAIPREAQIFKTAARVTIFHQEGLDSSQYDQPNVEYVPIKMEPVSSRLSLPQVLRHIGAEGMHDLWVETGGRCFQSLCEQGLIHRGLIYLGAKKLGKEAQTAFTPNFDVFTQSQAMQWHMFGEDALCEIDFIV